MCGRKKEISTNEYRMFNNYTDYRNLGHNDYAMTSRINRSSASERKIMEEFHPIHEETLTNYLKRTDIAENKLCEYGINHHLFGTKKTWSCHESSRYCFICTFAQYINTHRAINNELMLLKSIDKEIIHLDENKTITLQL